MYWKHLEPRAQGIKEKLRLRIRRAAKRHHVRARRYFAKHSREAFKYLKVQPSGFIQRIKPL